MKCCACSNMRTIAAVWTERFFGDIVCCLHLYIINVYMQWDLSRRGNKYGKTSFFCLLEKKNIRSFVDFRKSGIFAPHLEKCSFYKGTGGNSSVGRARPCQGRGRGSESRLPLNILNKPSIGRYPVLSPSGGIGRRARFRCVCLTACRFESCFGHDLFRIYFYVGEVAELVDALL